MAFQESRAYRKGLELLDAKEYAAAAGQLSKAIFLFPDEPELYMRRGDAYLMAYDINSATANYKRAVQLSQQRRDDDVAQQVQPTLMEVLDWQGCMAFQQGRVAKARSLFADAHRHSPNSGIVAFHRGIAELQLGKVAEAGADLLMCLNEAYVRPYQWVALALVSLREQDFKAARKYISHAMLGFSNNEAVQLMNEVFSGAVAKRRARATELMDAQQFEVAGRILDELLGADLDDTEMYQLRATCLSAMGNFTAAVQDLFESISKAGGSNSKSEEQLSKTLVIIAEELFGKGESDQAIEYFTEAIKWNPSVPQYFVHRGDCFAKMGKQSRALLDYKHVLDLDHTNELARQKLAQLHHTWGLEFYNAGNFSKAQAEFGECITYCPKDALYYFRRAQCFLMDKSAHRAAIKDLMKCDELGNTTPEMIRLIQQFCPTPTSNRKRASPRHAVSADGQRLFTIVQDTALLSPPDVKLRPQTRPAQPQRRESIELNCLRNQPIFANGTETQDIRHKVSILMQERGDISRPHHVWDMSQWRNDLVAAPPVPKAVKVTSTPSKLVAIDESRPSATAPSSSIGPGDSWPATASLIERKHMGPPVGQLRALRLTKPPAASSKKARAVR
eukprot:GGOE01002430.1.p1 GENE.GGOE01002430.1~~GGOE01002430.1.p1  ORF type:complete len:618 (-),score=201.10 GGOE01002430.1:284-2137(-)